METEYRSLYFLVQGFFWLFAEIQCLYLVFTNIFGLLYLFLVLSSSTGYSVFLDGVVVAVKSGMQRIVVLSSAEAEVIAVIQCVQEMIYDEKVVESMKLKGDLPMQVECNNKGAVDLVNGWAVGGNSKHIDVAD